MAGNTYGAVDANGIPVDAYMPPAADSGFLGWLNNALSGGANTLENRAKVQAILTDPNGTSFDQNIAQQKLAQDQAAAANMRDPGTGAAPYAFGGGGGPLSGSVTPDAVRGAINAPAAQGPGNFAPISSANAAPVQQAQAPAQPASLVQADAFRLPGAEAYGGLSNSDAGSITRAVSPTATYGFQATPPPADQTISMTDHIVGKTVDMVQDQPGENWYQKISHALANLPNDPLFNVGMALLGARPGERIGESVIRGFAQAAAFKDHAQAQQQQQLATQQAATQQAAIRGFDPSQFKSAKDAYTALLRSGVDPNVAANVVGTAFPASDYQGFAAGSTVIDKRTGNVVAQVPAALSGDAKAIQDLTNARDRFPIGSQQYTTYDNAIKKLAPANGVAAKPPTEFQSKSATFGARAADADKTLTALENSDAYSVTGQATRQALANIPGVGGIAGGIANAMTGPEGQRADQAQRNFVNAVLRQESGATITPAEFDNAMKQYFAQPGDSREVIAQKQRNRQLAIQGFNNSAGKAAFTPTGDLSGGGAPTQVTPTQAGAIQELKRRGKI
ncbi:hypothetical protein [Paraburkholderia sediminicola]|uniref:hypothetical protein n=1 Tax=Paraburkholderia sediminicola TaxID=458836 RepID=UPI0038B94155